MTIKIEDTKAMVVTEIDKQRELTTDEKAGPAPREAATTSDDKTTEEDA